MYDILTEQPYTPIPFNQKLTNYDLEPSSNSTRNKGTLFQKQKQRQKEKEKIYNIQDTNGNQVKLKTYNVFPIPTEITSKNLEKIKASKTDISCWWCCHSFDVYPVSMPLKYNDKTGVFKVKGCFCSFNCAKTYGITTQKNIDIGLFCLLHKMLCGTIKTISKAPPKEILQKFGGPISIEDYRQSFDTVRTYKFNTFPMVFIPSQVEEHEITKMIKSSIETINTNKTKKVIVNMERVNKAITRNTVMKNKKLADNNVNTLGKMMGIVSVPRANASTSVGTSKPNVIDYSEFE